MIQVHTPPMTDHSGCYDMYVHVALPNRLSLWLQPHVVGVNVDRGKLQAVHSDECLCENSKSFLTRKGENQL